MRLWDRLLHRAPDPPPPAPLDLTRDPDLDAVREEQHRLINRATALGLRAEIRDRFNERLRESWRPLHRDSS